MAVSNERILVTGGNGFLGSNLVRFFLKRSCTVFVISRNTSNLLDVLDSIRFEEHSAPGYAQFEDKIRDFLPSVAIHCAWDGGNSYTDGNSSVQVRNILYGTELLEALARLPHKPKFVGVGSFSEYGRIAECASESTPTAPTTLYGQCKVSYKDISELFCYNCQIPWLWIRPCLIYGPQDVSTRLIPSTIRKLVANEDLALDSCTSVVDYLHIDDFCSGVGRLLEVSSLGVANFCSGNRFSVRSIILWLKEEIDSKSKITFDPAKDRSMLSASLCGVPRALELAGWTPATDLYAGLRELVRQHRAGLLRPAKL